MSGVTEVSAGLTVFRVEDQVLIGRIGDLRKKGQKSWQIAHRLNQDRVRHLTQRGPWTAGLVREWHRLHLHTPEECATRRRKRAERERHQIGAPQTRADCATVPRPCPWLLCRYHLGVNVTSDGKLNRHEDPLDLTESCALDVADDGPQTVEHIAELIGVVRPHASEILARALDSLRRVAGEIGDEE